MPETSREPRSAPAPDLAPDGRYRLGVLFVHGIGQQGRGDTLVRFGEPLSDWLQHWIAGDEDGDGGPVRVSRARISPDAADPEAPAHAELEIRPLAPESAHADRTPEGEADDDDGRARNDRPPSVRWLLAEAWWAQRFITPSFRELASWGCQVLPWTITFHFATRARRAGQRIEDSHGRRRWLAVARLTLELLKLLLAILLFPLLAVLVLLILVIGALPIPRLRALIGAFQRLISGTLGDSFVLLSSPIQEAAIVGQVERDLGWLAARCERVAVVAHSQGAAVAHQVLRRRPPDNLVRLITLGSGLGKLEEIRTVWRSLERWDLWQAPAGLLVLGFSLPRLVRAASIDSGAEFTWLYLALLGLVFGALGIKRLTKESRPPASELALTEEAAWLDLYASSDPVPNGRLLDSEQATREIMQPVEVCNLGSAVADHTSYWRNSDQFVNLVARSLAAASDLPIDARSGEDASRLDVAGPRRRWRVGWLSAARVAAAALGLALVLRLWDSLVVLRADVSQALASLKGLVPLAGYLEARISGGEIAARTVGLGAIVASSALAYALLYGLWSIWNRTEIEGFFRRRRLEPFGFWFAWFAFALTLTFELAALVALGFERGLVSAVWESAKVGGAFFIAAMLLFGSVVIPVALFLSRFGWIGPIGHRGSIVGRIACASAVVAALFLPRGAWVATHQEAAAAGAWWRSLVPAPLQGGIATTNYWLAGTALAVLAGAFLLQGRFGYALVRRFGRWSCAEPPTLALAHRPEARIDPEELRRRLLARAEELSRKIESIEELRRKHEGNEKLVTVIEEQRRRLADEAIGIGEALAGSVDPAGRAEACKLLRVFAPHSALAAVALVRIGDATDLGIAAHGLLERHGKSGPRWQRRRVRKALRRVELQEA